MFPFIVSYSLYRNHFSTLSVESKNASQELRECERKLQFKDYESQSFQTMFINGKAIQNTENNNEFYCGNRLSVS
ncbi:hypothetical protein A0J61_02352 [Choanephora cucurbitarum]|uniref:Uncharacterized protein n=1 Tax=Choanephora cucurbitarum TaxID=101091 RepID=A0A1C7NKT9_9FUNG|nr:hypothetical protein A0J61_02352 [Choanephora cucurbitarum]